MTLKERLALHDKQLAAHDKQIKAIRELVHEGKRLGVETRKDMRQMLRGGNGHGKKKVDLQ